MNKRHFLHAALALATASLALQAPAQDFPPKKTITMVVGFAAGGAADTGALRVHLTHLRRKLETQPARPSSSSMSGFHKSMRVWMPKRTSRSTRA